MASVLSRIHNLYAYEDGDQINPTMGVDIEDGYTLEQYWDVNRGLVVNTDFKYLYDNRSSKTPAKLYPLPYSSKRGVYVKPDTQGYQWCYNNPDSAASEILDENGAVKPAFASKFEVSTMQVPLNNTTVDFPALILKDNFASADDLGNKRIFFKGTSDGKPFMCAAEIPVHTTTGDSKHLFVNITSEKGNVPRLTNDNTWVELTAHLQTTGSATDVTGVVYQWQRYANGQWVNVISAPKVTELTGTQKLKVWATAVDCEEVFRVRATLGNETWYESTQLVDEGDAYYIYDGCNVVGEQVDENQDVTFDPVVYKRRDNTPDQDNIWWYAYALFKMSNQAEAGRQDWKNPSDPGGKSYTVPYTTLKANKGLSVVISACNYNPHA